MPRQKAQSAIRDARDQLFLDTAEGSYLNVVSANLGVDRPTFGVTDDEWRAIVKAIALQTKGVRNIFHRVLEVYLGPQKSRIGVLGTASAIGDKIITLDSAEDLIQLGTLTFDPGLLTEETVAYCYRDRTTQQVFLNATLAQVHTVVKAASNYLQTTHLAGATSLVLANAAEFPSTGFPYPIIVDRGQPTEELLVVSSVTAPNTLNLASATTQDHLGLQYEPLRATLAIDAPAKKMYVELSPTPLYPADINHRFGASGVISVDGISEEFVEFTDNSADSSTLYLKTPLAGSHTAGDSVNLMRVRATVEVCSVIQRGVDWGVYETNPRQVQIYLPPELLTLKKTDAVWPHGTVPAAASTTLATGTSPSDTTVDVVSTSSFPANGMILIGGVTNKYYTSKDDTLNRFYLTDVVGATYSGGAAVALIRVPYTLTDLEEGNWRTLTPGAYRENYFPGSYVYSSYERSVTRKQSMVATSIPYPATVVDDQVLGYSTLEVDSALTWTASPPNNVRIGDNTGFEEDAEYDDWFPKANGTTTVSTFTPPNTLVAATSTTVFPVKAAGASGAGYRIRVGRGTANDEILVVLENNTGTNTFTLESAATNPHAATESIELMADVISLTGKLVQPHVAGHLVQPLLTRVELASVSDFPDSGIVLLNFGKARHSTYSYITTWASPTLTLRSTANFPTSGYPYPILLGAGSSIEGYALVTNNNTGTNQLTLDVTIPISAAFTAGQVVTYTPYATEEFSYINRSVLTNELVLAEETTFTGGFDVGTTAIYTPGYATTLGTGMDYPFYMTPDPSITIQLAMDLIRSAGVEVVFLSNR